MPNRMLSWNRDRRSARFDAVTVAYAVPALARSRMRTLLGVVLIAIALAVAYLFVILAVGIATAQQPQMPAAPQPVELVLEDQFERPAELAKLRGQVVILVYGDRKATDVCRTVGESLHVCWHPGAKGQPAAKAQAAPVLPLEKLRAGQTSPNVLVVPVACCGKVPVFVRSAIRAQIAKNVPDAVVWLDFADTMKDKFGELPGEANLVVFDVAGRLRGRLNGTPDQPKMDRLVQVVQDLRYEAAK